MLVNHGSPAGSPPESGLPDRPGPPGGSSDSPPDAPPGSRSSRFFPLKLPRLLSPCGTINQKQFFLNGLKIILLTFVPTDLPEILNKRYPEFFDSLSDPVRAGLLLADRAVDLFLFPLLLWIILCSSIKRLRDAGGHWAIAPLLCAGAFALLYYWPANYGVGIAVTSCFAIVGGMPSYRARPSGLGNTPDGHPSPNQRTSP